MDSGRSDWYLRLSRAEREVLEAYAKHHSYRAAARALGKSESVVDQQLLSARRKMGVTSTAEAMFKLAQRQASSEDIGLGSNGNPESFAPDGNAAKTLRKRFARWWAVPLLAITLAGLFVGIQARFISGRPSEPDSAPEIAKELLALRGSAGDQPQFEVRRAETAARLSEALWREQWGPDEARDVSEVLPSVEDAIRKAFDWACVYRPDLAIRIIGNGHRMFKLTAGQLSRRWLSMIESAMKLPPIRDAAYGRLQCGFAFTKIYKNGLDIAEKGRGFAQASNAFQFFHARGLKADEANALRHMGMCCIYWDRKQAKHYYDDALSRYERIGDLGGIAQTRLSLAQMAPDDESDESWYRLGSKILDAIKACKRSGSRSALGEALDEVKMLPRISSKHGDLLRSLRFELLERSQYLAGEHEGHAAVLALAQCTEIDAKLSDYALFTEDLELALANPLALTLNRKAVAQLMGYHDTLCNRLGRANEFSSAKYPDYRADFQAGKRLSLAAASRIAFNLVSPNGSTAP